MVTVDKPSLDQSLRRWNAHLATKIDMTHLAGQDVVRVEAGRLVQTLVRITPPEDRSASMQKLGARVEGKFHTLGSEQHSFHELAAGGKAGNSDVRWYAFQSDGIYGVAEDADMTNATADGLYRVYFDTPLNKEGRIVAGHRGRQTVYIWRKITTKLATVKKLAARLKRHFGRLKAAWLAGWIDLGRPTGTYAPPAWVLQHETGARGYSINGLGDPRYPQFTLENHAKGAGSAKMNGLARDTMEIRSQAMVKRMSFLIKHPEKLAEEV
jgi:hypothetical protein